MSAYILIVEDDELQQQMLSTLLMRKLDFSSLCAGNGRKALDILEQKFQEICLVILDLQMPVMGGMETLEILAQKYPALPVIMLTGNQDVDNAIKAMRLGAVDYISKPYEGDRMVTTVRNALKLSSLTKEVNRLTQEKTGTFTFDHLIGDNAGLLEVVSIGRKAAASDIPVLITGETGTGKEVFAKAIHGESSRSGKPFIAVNCGAIPGQLVESTLFGHEKGSFTGATEKVPGKFREAEGGTIFLDEVGELPLDMQVKLLRVLQQKEVEPVGAAKPIHVNVRILSATNRDLRDEVKNGRFREDLFFRLNVLELHIPPLRERKSDVVSLANHFIGRYCAQQGMVVKSLGVSAQDFLCEYDWPGNVRQLENMMQRAIVMVDGQVIERNDLSSRTLQTSIEVAETLAPVVKRERHEQALHLYLLNDGGEVKTMEQLEQEAMQMVLTYFQDNITKASEALGMAKSTFYRKMKEEG